MTVSNEYRQRLTKFDDAELLATLAALTAGVSLTEFSRFVFEVEPPVHAAKVWIPALEAIERGEITKLCVIAPPGHAKSTYHSIIFPTWYIGRHYNATLIGITTADPLGKLYGDTIRDVLETSDQFRAVFPGVVPDTKRGWAKDGFFVKGPTPRPRRQKDATMGFFGAGGAVIGRRADGVIIDDAVDEDTARSELLLEQRKTWINRTAFSRLKPGGWRIVCGTMWAEDDVVDSAMRSGEYVVVHMAARSPGAEVEADLWIPNGVAWRP